MKQWLSASELAEITTMTKQGVIAKAKRENWPRRTFDGSGGKEYRYHLPELPKDIQAAYAVSLKTTLEELQNQLKPASKDREKSVAKGTIARYTSRTAVDASIKSWDECTETERGIALTRVRIIQAYDGSGLPVTEFIQMYESGVIAPDVKARLGRWGHIHTPSVFYSHWLLRYKQFGVAGLVPQYKERGGNGASLSEEEKDRIEWLYLDSSKPSIRAVLDCLSQYGIEKNYAIVYRYIKTLPASLIARWRMGEKYFHDKYETYIERDYTLLKSLETICGDYMTEDLACLVDNKIVRARLCAFEDMRSRAIVGWSLQLTANSVGVVRSLKMAFEKYGLPITIYVDNGKEFKNYWLCGDEWKLRRTKIDPDSLEQDAGILNEAGVKIAFCEPYHGQSKPVERFWRTFHERFDKFVSSYLGSNTATRPDEAKLYRHNIDDMKSVDIGLIPTFAEIEKLIGNFIEWYNAEWHHSGQGMDGKTPYQVLAENALPKREIPEHLKKYLFTMRSIKTVQRNGVKLDGTWYYVPELQQYIGQKVEVRQGLDNAGKVHIFSIPDRKFLFDAEDLAWSGVPQEDIHKIKKLRREAKSLQDKFNKKKAEYNEAVFKTPAEIYAEEQNRSAGLKAVGGEPLIPALLPAAKPRRNLVGIFDAEDVAL